MIRDYMKNGITNPVVSLVSGYLFLIVVVVIFFVTNLYPSSQFFRWGPPVTIMGTDITGNLAFYTILIIFFIHQLITTWISNTTYPWIINNVQDSKTKIMDRNDFYSLTIVVFNVIYSQLDLLFIINASLSQVSFFLVVILAQVISEFIVNFMYLRNKKRYDLMSDD